jgi:SAM-dependent methyltransferase
MANMLRKEEALENGLVQTIFRPCAEFLIKQAQLKSNERLLDIGCGSGIAARVALERHPNLAAAHGFDYAPAAINIAMQMREKQIIKKEKMAFWTGDASNPKDYKGEWDVCIAQHVVQHVSNMLVPLRDALAPHGRAVICTWPVSSRECDAYNFLYTAAGEEEKEIGMSMDKLVERVQAAGFNRIEPAVKPNLTTPSVDPAEFLRQYLEGKVAPPLNLEEYLNRPLLKECAKNLACRAEPDGRVHFVIAINTVLAWK